MAVVTPERERSAPPHAPEPPSQPPPPPPEPPRRRSGISWGGVALAVVVLSIVAVVDRVGDVIPDFQNPFRETTVDRTGPAVLRSIQDIGEYRAAAGNYQVIVDIEKDTRLPDELLGERTLFVAIGSVDAGVDLGAVSSDDVEVSDDRRSATITLPEPELFPAEVDLGRSYVYEQQRGFFNKLQSVFEDDSGSERELYLAAEQRLNEAARANDDLETRAEENTRAMLESLLHSLGFTDVTVRFDGGS